MKQTVNVSIRQTEKHEDVGYVRTSLTQINEENQVKKLIEFGIPKQRIFIDRATSGSVAPLERPDFQNLLSYIRNSGSVRRVISFEISRLGRNVEESARLLVNIEKEYDITFWSLSKIEEIFNQIQERGLRFVFFTMFAYGAQLEREHLRERTKNGMETIQQEISENGYYITREGKRIESIGKPPAVKVSIDEVLRLKDEGKSVRDIATILGSSKSTIHDLLKRHYGS